jgi:hypothetical protein
MIMLIVEAPLLITASMSPLVPRPALLTSARNPCLAMSLTASSSPSDTAAKPASITSTPSSSSRWAMRSLFSDTRDTPGVCSPSRRVVSKNFMVLGKRLNKAIPHLNHISCFRVNQPYKNFGNFEKKS